MSEATDLLQADEQQALQREQELQAQEHEMHQQEQGLIDMERAYAKRSNALVNLLGYVGEQERSLLTRAEAIGTGARALVAETIEAVDEASVLDELDFGMEELRQTMLERRLDLQDARTALLEDRESLFEERAEKLENAESRIAELEEDLVTREMEIASVLRRLITGAADFDDVDETASVTDTASSMKPAPHTVRETNTIGRESLEVESGTAEVRKDAPTEAHDAAPKPSKAQGAGEAATKEEAAADVSSTEPVPELIEETGPEAEEAADQAADQGTFDDGGVRFNLEATMDGDTGHTFFSYDDDGEEDLPGLFLATKNLLKEDRAVRVALSIGDANVQLKGIVAWRRMEADSEGPSGMGIEITWLGPGAPEALGNWLAENSPITV
jgi:hypothetical protein